MFSQLVTSEPILKCNVFAPCGPTTSVQNHDAISCLTDRNNCQACMDHNSSADPNFKYVIDMCVFVCVCVSRLLVEMYYLLAAFDSAYAHGAQPPFLQTVCEPMAQQKSPIPM